ncbi:unnamed protein product, partial [Prorocentrum cordatum]
APHSRRRMAAGPPRLTRWLVLLVGLRGAAAEELGQIRGRVSIPPKFTHELPPSTGGLSAIRVLLDGGARSALPTTDGHFLITGVTPGPHLLQVAHPRLIFDPVRVEAQESGDGAMKMSGYIASFEHGRGNKLKYPLMLQPSGSSSYLEKREDFDILSVFKSPMTLMMLFSCGAMFLLPKLQPMLDEEKERNRLEKEGEEPEKLK